MVNKQTIQQEINLTATLKQFAQAYEEVSVVRMQRVRSSVLSNRDFEEKLLQVFQDVKSSYRQEILQLLKEKNKKLLNKLSVGKKNGRVVNAYVAPNTKLHGDIVKRSYQLFLESVRKQEADVVIVGRVGKELYEQELDKKPYTYFDLPEINVKSSDIKPLITFLVPYETVNVFYGKFTNVIQQIPTVTNVTGGVPMGESYEQKEKVKYFFEPSLEKVLLFFENEVFGSFVLQTVHEGELARLASRITAMEDALVNIQKNQGTLKGQERRFKRLIQNKKQIESFAGITLWNS